MRTLLALALLLAPSLAEAGAWTKELGSVYAKADAGAYVAGSYVDPSQEEPVSGRYVGQRYSLYAEAGFLPWHPVQVSVSVPLVVGTVWFGDERLFGEGNEAQATSLRGGDFDVSLQALVLPPKLPFKLSANVGLKVPLYSNDAVGEAFGVWKDAFPLPGDGQLDVTGMLLFGGSVPGDIAPWFEGWVGYRHRSEVFVGYTTDREFVDGIPFGGLVGVKLPKGWALVRGDVYLNVLEDDDSREGVLVTVQGAVQIGKGFSIEGRFGGEPWVRSASQGVSFGLGLSWQR